MKRKRVLLTGAAGDVGTMFREAADHIYDFVCYDQHKTEGVKDAIKGELADQDKLTKAAKGCEAFVHLAAFPRPADFLEVILPNNIIGCYNAFEAAVRARVKRFVFASSVQVDWGYGEEVKVPNGVRPAPANVYGASKIFGENLGRIYNKRYGLSVICLRFGSVATMDAAEWMLQYGALPSPIAILPKDACEILRHAIEAKNVNYAVLPAFSHNAARIRDLSILKKTIGYEPQEDCYELWGVGPVEE